jgi:anti-sigma regulatory factor (Ser/Thr protein kinase)
MQRILVIGVIGHEPAIDELAREFGAEHECQVEWVADEAAAISRLSPGPYDAVLAGPAGEIEDRLKVVDAAGGGINGPRVIVFGDGNNPGEVVSAMRRGAFSFFSRPFQKSAIREMIFKALAAPASPPSMGLISASPNWLIVRLQCDAMTVDRLIQFVREMKTGLTQELREQLTTAFREMLLNAAEHGCRFDDSKQLEISFARTARLILYQIRDPGQGFRLESMEHAAVGNPVGQPFRHVEYRDSHGMRPGGFGILLARKIVDEMLYNERGNEVLLIKYL